MVRVLIADDSPLVCTVLRDILCCHPGIEVVAEVRDGRQAVEETRRLRPDLIIMDVMMPVMDGLDAVIEIMASAPTPILVLSSNVDPADSRSAFQAIQHGALDIMEKPAGMFSDGFPEIADTLIEKVKALSRIRVMHHFRGRRPLPPPAASSLPVGPRNLLAIGASTGGPKAVMRLLREIPRESRARIVVVQHISCGFAAGFAEWLDRDVPCTVRLARDGEVLPEGVALVAPNNRHLEIVDGRVLLSETAPVNSCRPSVDVLFRSLARQLAPSVVAVLLSGMGRDGAEGMAALRRSGGYNIVQDEASCAVFGMPKVAVELGAPHQVLPLGQIGPRVLELLGT
jgi:two-component system chemotaxis response regulator CheB